MASQTRSVCNTVSSQWVNPDNAFSENDLCTQTDSDGDQNVYNFLGNLFSIPSGATIDGIEVKTIRGGDGDDFYEIELQDSVPAWKLKTGAAYSGSCAGGVQETLGGSSDKWGGTWTRAHINSTSFQVRLTYQKSGKANLFYVDYIEVVVYYSTGPILKEVTDSLSLSDMPYVDKTLPITDIIGLADSVTLPTKTVVQADAICLSDAVLLPEKTVVLTDSIGLSDAITLSKLFEIVDSISLSDVVTLPNKTVILSDSIDLADANLLPVRTIIVTDSVGLADTILLPTKTVLLSDAISLADAILLHSKTVIVLDTVGLADAIIVLKLIEISDSITLADLPYIDKPVLITDAIGLSDVPYADKILIITDSIALSDVPYADKTLILTDAIILSDVPYADKLLIVTDSISLSDQIETIVWWLKGIRLSLAILENTIRMNRMELKSKIGITGISMDTAAATIKQKIEIVKLKMKMRTEKI